METINKIIPDRGQLLISEPFLSDPYFRRSVILVSDHNEEGITGFILNKPTDLKVNEAIQDFPSFEATLYFGGPVQLDTLHYIHTLGDKLKDSKKLMKGIYWGGDFEELKLLIDLGQVRPSDIRFFVGSAGWDPNQLKYELKEKSWIISSVNPFLFSNNEKDLWSKVLRSMGKEYAIIANFPEDPSLN